MLVGKWWIEISILPLLQLLLFEKVCLKETEKPTTSYSSTAWQLVYLKRNVRKWMSLLIKFANKQTFTLVEYPNVIKLILVLCPSSTSLTEKRPSSETSVMMMVNSLS